MRVEQSLRRRRRERPDAGARRRDHVAEHRVLALEVRVLDVVASGDELREPLDDERLRRDRVAADRRTRASITAYAAASLAVSTTRPCGSVSLTRAPPPSRSRSARGTRPRRCRSPCSRGSRSTIAPSLLAIAPSGQKSAHSAQALHASRQHGPVERPGAGVVAERVGRADREASGLRRVPRRGGARLERRVARDARAASCTARSLLARRATFASAMRAHARGDRLLEEREPVRERAASRTRRARRRCPSAGLRTRGCRSPARCATPGRARCRTGPCAGSASRGSGRRARRA